MTHRDSQLDQMPDVLTIDQLAFVLQTSPTTIKRRLHDGTFPIRKLTGIDRRHRWSRSDVRRFLERDRTVARMGRERR